VTDKVDSEVPPGIENRLQEHVHCIRGYLSQERIKVCPYSVIEFRVFWHIVCLIMPKIV
jgi:hypothetical protein